MTTTEASDPYDVFLVHAGEEKKEFVDFLRGHLRLHGLKVFVDEFCLEPGTRAPQHMLYQLSAARMGKARQEINNSGRLTLCSPELAPHYPLRYRL